VRLLALLSITFGTLGMGGCFYIDPINQRPGLRIENNTAGQIERGQQDLTLQAIADDPEEQFVGFHWRVYICSDAADFATCDQEPTLFSLLDSITFDVPTHRIDPDGPGSELARPAESLLVILEGKDDHGATAKPAQELIIPLDDASPNLVLDQLPLYDSVIGTPIDLYAVYGDADDAIEGVTIEWKAFSPSQVEINLTDLTGLGQPTDPNRRQVGKQLVPTALGSWDIVVTATDPIGKSTVEHLTVVVGPDNPPCLEQWSPIALPDGNFLPMTEPTLFQVPVVSDALDRYPTVLDPVLDPASLLGPTVFVWSLKQGSGPRAPLAATGNSVALDPASFSPGEELELRVEIFDRNDVPISCGDTEQTCSVISTACIQRQTWNVEVR